MPPDRMRPSVLIMFMKGQDIGVAGYPIARLSATATGQLSMDGLIYRVGRGTVSAHFVATPLPTVPNVPLVEVNFLFVPGNSGGPVFLADTGEVIGFVHAFQRFQNTGKSRSYPPNHHSASGDV